MLSEAIENIEKQLAALVLILVVMEYALGVEDAREYAAILNKS